MGWQSCSFLVTPQQLEKALEPFALVVDNACVPIDYTNIPVGILSKFTPRCMSGWLTVILLPGKMWDC